MLLQKLLDRNLISSPKWLTTNTAFLTQMGSIAYGINTDASDVDFYGFALPPIGMVFPHLVGHIPGFGSEAPSFKQWVQHHVKDGDTQYDFTVFGIVRYFDLLMQNNPNVLDSLFVPQNCIVHCTSVGNMVRESRRMFFHKGSWHKFKGYSYSQLHKASTKEPEKGSKRAATREEFGMDVKFLCHTVRLLYEAEMILTEGDLDLQRHREHLKSIRRGDISEVDIRQWAADKEKDLEKMYVESKLPYGPDCDKIKSLLLQCLEHHYGSLDKCIVDPGLALNTLKQITELVDKNRQLLGL